MPVLPLQLLAASFIGTVAAGDPPGFSIPNICQRRVVFERTPATLEACRMAEQNALDELKSNWHSYPERFAKRCSIENEQSQPSYVAVVECINMGVLSAQGELNPPAGGAGPEGVPPAQR